MDKKIVDSIRKDFPNVDQEVFNQLIDELDLYEQKNADYAKVGDKHGNFLRVSAIKRIWPNMDWSSPVGTAISYGLKQFDAAMQMISEGYEGGVENKDTRLRDWVIYLEIARSMLKHGEKYR